jgi:hypothetical protein
MQFSPLMTFDWVDRQAGILADFDFPILPKRLRSQFRSMTPA